MSTTYNWEDVPLMSESSDNESSNTRAQSELTDSYSQVSYDEISIPAPNFDKILKQSLEPIFSKLNVIECYVETIKMRLENTDKNLEKAKRELENTTKCEQRELKYYSELFENSKHDLLKTKTDFQNSKSELALQLEKRIDENVIHFRKNLDRILQQSLAQINKKLSAVESLVELNTRKLANTDKMLEKSKIENRKKTVALIAIFIPIIIGVYVIKDNDNKVNDLSTKMKINKTLIEITDIVIDLSQNATKQQQTIEKMENNLNALTKHYNQTSFGELKSHLEIKSKLLDELIIDVNNSLIELKKFGIRMEIIEKEMKNISKLNNKVIDVLTTKMVRKNDEINKTMIEISKTIMDLSQNTRKQEISEKKIENMENNLNSLINHHDKTYFRDLKRQLEIHSKLLDELIIEVDNSLTKHKIFGKRVELLENQVQSISKIKLNDVNSVEWEPDIRVFTVPNSVKSGANNFWVNCSLLGITVEEVSQFILTISKDNEIFYIINNNFEAHILPVSGVDSSQLLVSNKFYGSVRIKNPTVKAKGVYRCTLTTTRRGVTKTAFKEYFVNVIVMNRLVNYNLLDAFLLTIIALIIFVIVIKSLGRN